jgi:phage terminase small subunit
LEGTYRADRHATRIDAHGKLPSIEKPAWLQGVASELWDAIVSTLPPAVLCRADAATLAGACRWWAEWQRWDAELLNPNSQIDPYKATMAAEKAWRCYLAAASKVGLSPVDRARLDVSAKPESPGDALDEFTKQSARVVG